MIEALAGDQREPRVRATEHRAGETDLDKEGRRRPTPLLAVTPADPGEDVAHEVDAAALPRRALQHPADRGPDRGGCR